MADIYLPNTHGSIPTVIKVGGICYEYDSTISRDDHQEDHCWDEVTNEFSTCDDCCFPNIKYKLCPAPSSSSSIIRTTCNSCDPGIPESITVVVSGLTNGYEYVNGTHIVTYDVPEGPCFWRVWIGDTNTSLDLLWGGSGVGWSLVMYDWDTNDWYQWLLDTGSCDYTGSYPYEDDFIGQGPGATAVVG